jgi:hypothetical protein
MKTAVIKRSITIGRRKTSISLEDEFWYGLLEIAVYKQMMYRRWSSGSTIAAKRSIFHPQFAYSFSTISKPTTESESLTSASCAKLVQT